MNGTAPRAAGLLLVAVALAAGCSSTPPTPLPPPAATPDQTAALPTAATLSPTASPDSTSTVPSPTPGPTPTPVLAISAGALRSVPGYEPDGARPSVAHGPMVFHADRNNLVVADLSTGRYRAFATAPTHGAQIVAATASRAFALETWHPQASSSTGQVPGCAGAGTPLSWRLWAVDIATGSRELLDSGNNRRIAYGGECADVNPPAVAANGNRVAYTQEAASPAFPFATRIVVLLLTTGATVRSIVAPGFVMDLGMSGHAIAYRDCEVPAGPDAIDQIDCAATVVADDRSGPQRVDAHADALAIGAGRLAWHRDRRAAGGADGSILTRQIGATASVWLGPPIDPAIVPDDASFIAAASDVVAWSVDGTGSDEARTSELVVWTTRDPVPRAIDGFGPPGFQVLFNAVGAGWLTWFGQGIGSTGKASGLYGARFGALVPLGN